MSPARKAADPKGITIPWPFVGVLATLVLASLGGIVWINVQIATLATQQAAVKEKVDMLFSLEMDRHPRAGPPAPPKE